MRVWHSPMRDITISQAEKRRPRKDLIWSVAAFVGFGMGVLCFVAVSTVSVLTVSGVLDASSLTANVTAVALMAALGFAYFGAHALDKIEERARAVRDDG